MAPKKKGNAKGAKAAGKGKGNGAKGQNVAASAAGNAVQPPDARGVTVDVNADYKARVSANLKVVLDKYPTLVDQPPLPMVGDDGFKGLTGYGATFDEAIYDTKYASYEEFTCNTNLLQHSLLQGALPYVPLYFERVAEYAESNLTTPTNVLSNAPLVLEMTFANAKNIVHGEQRRLSPCEPIHALIHRFATRILDGAENAELDGWIRIILSYPTAYKRMPGDDAEIVMLKPIRCVKTQGVLLVLWV